MKGFKAERATPEQIRFLQYEKLCKRYSWTLDYVRSLGAMDVQRIFGIIEAENELAKIERERAKQMRGSSRRRR